MAKQNRNQNNRQLHTKELDKRKGAINPIELPMDLPEEVAEAIKLVPTESREKFLQLFVSTTSTKTIRKSMLPPSDEFQKYEETLPGMANRLMAMSEKEQEYRHSTERSVMEKEQSHRQEMDRKIVDKNLLLEERNQVMTFLLAIGLFGVGVLAMYLQMQWVAVTIFGTTVISIWIKDKIIKSKKVKNTEAEE